jgi:glycosyltransferase involved in cell wall biosynthesis
MKIWLINPYGQIPGEGWRDYRFTMLGKTLAGCGHEVVWWTASFSHTFKRFRSQGWEDLPISPGFTIRLVPTSAYRGNISVGRLGFEWSYARNTHKRARESEKPDCIVATDPSQIVGFMSARLAKAFGVPLVLDVFDLWPELFTLVLPKWLRPFSGLIFSPFYLLRKYNVRQADGVVSLCRTYLNVALHGLSRSKAVPSLTVFNGIDLAEFRREMPDENAITETKKRLGKTPGEIWAVYTGTLSDNYDVRALVEAAEILAAEKSAIRIIVLGEGTLRHRVSEFVQKHPGGNLRYLGPSMASGELLSFYKASDIALCAYSKDSNVAMPNKAYDYLAAGLPIVNSLKGELAEFLAENGIGVSYEAGDPRSLVEALRKLADDSELREAMARNADRKAAMFDSGSLYREYASFVEQVCGRCGIST